tara:strand:- start:57 stop:716 length:660 start_codon:yes stop_codon:yes gene_type:complete
MRELVFSVGITFLTGTLLFVYFRNKMNNIDKKVNLVFNTIQEHNSRMQNEAEEEMKRFQMYHEQQMQMQQMHQMEHSEETEVPLTQENVNEMIEKENNLIDVSDEESQFDSSEDDSDDEDSDNEQPEQVVEPVDNSALLKENLEVEVLEDNTDDVIVDEEKHEGLEIMEDKLEIKSLEPLVDYNKLTKAQLRNICEDKGLTGWKSLNKGKLVELLKNNN